MPDFKTPSELFYAHRAEQRNLYFTLAFGLIVLAFSIYEYKSGKVWAKFIGWVEKADHPWIYWAEVIGGFVCGIGITAYAFFRLWQMHSP
jgi:hypothetical protein